MRAPRGFDAVPTISTDEGVSENPEEPRLEVRARRELMGAQERACVGLLHQILRIRTTTGEVPGKIVQHVDIRQGFLAERHGVRSNSLMKSGQLMTSNSFVPRCRKTARPRLSMNVTDDRS